MSATPVRVERSGPGGAVARVTLDRPGAAERASTRASIDGLRAAFAGFAAEPPEALRAVVLAGEGRAFCAGADVAWMRAATTMPRDENEAARGDARAAVRSRSTPARPRSSRGSRGRRSAAVRACCASPTW